MDMNRKEFLKTLGAAGFLSAISSLNASKDAYHPIRRGGYISLMFYFPQRLNWHNSIQRHLLIGPYTAITHKEDKIFPSMGYQLPSEILSHIMASTTPFDSKEVMMKEYSKLIEKKWVYDENDDGDGNTLVSSMAIFYDEDSFCMDFGKPVFHGRILAWDFKDKTLLDIMKSNSWKTAS